MMKVISADAINHQFDMYAQQIKDMAMPDAEERLLETNEANRRRFLNAFETNGKIEVIATGIYWRLVERNNSRLQACRKKKGLSQSALAKASGVDVRLIQHYEQGTKNINKAAAETVLQLADALGVDIREILNT